VSQGLGDTKHQPASTAHHAHEPIHLPETVERIIKEKLEANSVSGDAEKWSMESGGTKIVEYQDTISVKVIEVTKIDSRKESTEGSQLPTFGAQHIKSTTVANKAQDGPKGVGGCVHDVAVGMKDKASEVASGVVGKVSGIRETATHVKDAAANKVRNIKDNALEYIQKTLEQGKG